MSYCVCGGYLGSGGVDSYSGRWCRCATTKQVNNLSITTTSVSLQPLCVKVDPTQTEIDELKEQIKTLVSYMRTKIDQADWHAVADAAMDIRELEAKIKVYESIL